MLFEKFGSFISEKRLVPPGSKVLLAVSGGIDSAVMLHLFYRLQVPCEIAHCNFQLRGKESDDDERLVAELSAKYMFPFFVTRFETADYAEEHGLSIQMAARELRYTWFHKLANAHQCNKIAIAHNRDDAMETFFINLGRGAGIAGLTGMRTSSDKIIRPLLFASRKEIEQYSLEYHLSYREDSSNAQDKYLRNYIRHNILPAFDEINPHFRDSMSRNMEKLSDAYTLYRIALENILPYLVTTEKDVVILDISKLLETPAPKTILFEILKKYGFSATASDEIFQMHNSESGRQYFSSSHKVVKDRSKFLITSFSQDAPTKTYIEENTEVIEMPVKLRLEVITEKTDFKTQDSSIAFLDYEKLSWPLILRKWKKGDYFRPLGMSGLKKVSDFFIDLKMSLIEKENTWLLTSADEIAWIVGRRIDDRFKITGSTKKILKIKIEE